MTEAGHYTHGMSKHRIDALTDGIFAVAMTLLVIELKIPEALHVASNAGLISALVHLIPKFVGWVISFLVLALFWYGHHRAFHFVRRVNGPLVALNILFLGFVSFMPFASGIAGEYTGALAAQVVYSITMILLSISSITIWRYLHRHPELCEPVMSEGVYQASRFRTFMLMLISLVAIVIALFLPGFGNAAFMLMFVVGPIARRIEAKYAVHNNPAATLSV